LGNAKYRQMVNAKKILIIRFSSFGDIVHSMSVIGALKDKFPNSEVHWLCRSDFVKLLQSEKRINKVWGFDRKAGLFGLLKYSAQLSSQNFDIIYDAHSNLRSKIASIVLRIMGAGHLLIRRPKSRIKRILLFKLGINKFPQPFRAMHSYIQPLIPLGVEKKIIPQKWEFSTQTKEKVDQLILNYKNNIILVPSAAHAMKRWPVSHWKQLIANLEKYNFVVLGGPEDDFCEEIALIDKMRVQNLAGKLSLEESSYVISKAELVISGDTGLLQVADLLGMPTIALIGPTAFGFPSGEQVKTIDLPLDCRPCTKDGSGSCKNTVYQRCMVEITAQQVAKNVESFYES